MNGIMNAACLREIGLSGGERILDMGSGLGQFSRAMARAAGPKSVVVGVERSLDQIAKARAFAQADGEESLVDFRHGDAVDLPLSPSEWSSFDVVHARFLLEHVPEPIAVVRSMVRAARPGGRIVIQDDDHDVLRVYPEPAGFTPLWNAYMRAYDRLGNDPFIGRRLVTLLHRAGAQPVRSTWIFFGACAGEAQFPGLVENMIGVIVSAREYILQEDLIEAASFDGAVAELWRWSGRPDAALWYSMCWAEGRVP